MRHLDRTNLSSWQYEADNWNLSLTTSQELAVTGTIDVGNCPESGSLWWGSCPAQS